jgi:TRAP-type transport system small permease protein
MEKYRHVAAMVCGILAVIALTAMMMLTVADVTMRTFFNTPLRGVIEIVELMLACTFFLALPASFLRNEHIVVDLIDGALPRAVPWLKRIGLMIAVVMIAIMAWQGLRNAEDSFLFGDVTSDLSLPRSLYWAPVLIGLFGSCIAAAVMAMRPLNKQ